MSALDREIRKHFRTEADRLLFEDIRFDSRLREKVLQSTNADSWQLPAKVKFSFNRGKWLKGAAVAAAVACFLIVAAPAVTESPAPPSGTALHPGNKANVDRPAPEIGGQPPAQPNMTMAAPLSTADEKTWRLRTPEEARKQFGHALPVPSSVPDRFTLQEINASGPREGEAANVAFNYVSNGGSFRLTASKQAEPYTAESDKIVDINGVTGYLKTGEAVELKWYADGVQYTLSGSLSGDEALTIAGSMTEK